MAVVKFPRWIIGLSLVLLLPAGCTSDPNHENSSKMSSRTVTSPTATAPSAATNGTMDETTQDVHDTTPTNSSSTAAGGGDQQEATVDDLRAAEVPAYCSSGPQKLVDGRWPTDGSVLGTQWQIVDTYPDGRPLDPVFIDMMGSGTKQAFGVYGCTAGAPGWPEVLELVGPGGKMLGFIKLEDTGQQQHAVVTAVSPQGSTVVVSWDSYEGCCGTKTHYRSVVSWSGGALRARSAIVAPTVSPHASPSDDAPVDGWNDHVYWARQNYDLNLSKPMAVPRCNGQWALIVANETNASTRKANIERLLARYPGAEYVHGGASSSCSSLRAKDDAGNEVYAVVVELPDKTAVCSAAGQYQGATYAKPLDNGSSSAARAFYVSNC